MIEILVLRRHASSGFVRSQAISMYAIVQTGGKQYRVSQGDLLQIELLDPGQEKVEFSQVFLVSNGRDTAVGRPLVSGAKVTGSVVSTGRAPKILVFKKKRRKHHKRTIGHRQYFSAVRILDIDAGGAVPVLKTKKDDATVRAAAAGKKAAGRKKTVAKKKAAPRKAASAKKSSGKSTVTTVRKTARSSSKGAGKRGGKSKPAGKTTRSSRAAQKPAKK
ncbi:MAG: 50S ribosomal protein L21 [Acidobacteriota bacterium]